MSTIRVLLVAWSLATALSTTSWGQCTGTGNPSSCTVTIRLPVTDVLRLSVSATSTSLGTPTEADYAAGYRDAVGPVLEVKANRPFQVQVVAATGNFTYSGTLPGVPKPASDLLIGTNPGGPFVSVATPSQIMSGASGAPILGQAPPQQAVYFRTLWSLTSPPGDYSLELRFTISTP